MARTPRDRATEAASIAAAAARLLAGTPLRSTSGKLTTTELITESGLRRDVVYEHATVVEDFQARVKAQHSTPASMPELADKSDKLEKERETLKADLAAERATNAALRRIVVELSLELDQANEELAAAGQVTRLPNGHQRATR
jgi:hypothetical protein